MKWRQRRIQLASSTKETNKDITTFGEELQILDSEVAERTLDEAMRQDYQQALDAYEDAKVSISAVKRPEDIRHVTEILEDGRYAVASVKARVAGEPLPQRRSPCFFNPAHGPSVQNVDWAPSGGAVRSVPACAADTERVLAGADPSIRTVLERGRRVPYWQAGPAYAPWVGGYYSQWGGSDLLTGLLIGSALSDSGGFYGSGEPDGGGSDGGGFFDDLNPFD
jgi:hypothetical protein